MVSIERLVLVFTKKKEESGPVSQILRELLSSKRGVIVTTQETTEKYFLLIHAEKEFYLRKAEQLRLLKPLKNNDICDEFSVRFSEKFKNVDEDNFIQPSEKLYILTTYLRQIVPNQQFKQIVKVSFT